MGIVHIHHRLGHTYMYKFQYGLNPLSEPLTPNSLAGGLPLTSPAGR